MLFDALVVLAMIAVVVAGIFFLVKAGGLPSEWEPREKSLGDGIKIVLVKRREKPFEIGIARKGESFDEDLAWLRAQAKSDCANLNLGRKLLR